jgi:glycosyltransferase involved in cell wall biosynthesis
MKVLVYPHVLEIGGSQLNAVELAAGVRDLGHEVVVFGQPGPLTGRIAELGLEFVAAPDPGRRPSAGVIRALAGLVGQCGFDVLHGYEWTAGLEAYLAGRLGGAAPFCTVMSMAVAPFLPKDLPLVVGTEQIGAHERELGRALVSVIEPPVDVLHNAVEAVPGLAEFRRRFGLDSGVPTVVSVSRLAAELKLEGLLTAIDLAGELAGRIRLLVVGDGPARAQVEERAAKANAAAGAGVVVLTGELADPRPAYAVADIALGMGGSALRAMAFGAPLIVQGERGFWELLTPDTLEQFLWAGWYGVGDDPAAGPDRLRGHLLPLLDDPVLRERLGGESRQLAVERFALDRASKLQLDLYTQALAAGPRGRLAAIPPAASAIGGVLSHKVRRKVARLRGNGRSDDFNAKPVAALGRPAPPSSTSASTTTIKETLP